MNNTIHSRSTPRGGRPRLTPAERRSEKLAAAVTPETREAFQRLSESAGLSTSDFLREVIELYLRGRAGAEE